MKNVQYLTTLTPLRGIAALFVLVFHADLFMKADTGILIPHEISGIIKKGYLMVDFFFVLSGFIMSYVYASSFTNRVRLRSYKEFLVARLARIYPLHLVTLVWIVIIFLLLLFSGNYRPDPISELHNNFWALPSQVLLLHSMHLHNFTTWNGPSWSISVEWWMYMLFPFLVPLIAQSTKAMKITIAAMAWIGMWWIVLYLNPVFPLPLPFPIPPQYTLDVTADFGFLRCMFGFLIGSITFYFYKDGSGQTIIGRTLIFCSAVVAAAVMMHFEVYDTFSVLTFPVIIMSAAYSSGSLASIFESKPLQWLGDLSYSIYLTHVPVWATAWAIMQVYFPNSIPPVTTANAWIVCLIWIALTLIVSAITYRFIEVPGRAWIKSLLSKRQSQLTATA